MSPKPRRFPDARCDIAKASDVVSTPQTRAPIYRLCRFENPRSKGLFTGSKARTYWLNPIENLST